ncbi:hypothetical protein [Chitinophaga qingshengii]|uniref:Uncharacterized protein n=1 Tax=Chitinophaga qingshengii TaxID=1569794 RepID=A0ABR7TVD3_9BACT|nr:hypothetical protein [Chitinophaga qingshengii]MBC9934444.1 hypothetical protein [Chitinophaga qingshengii]
MNIQQNEVWKLLYPRVPANLSRNYRNGLFNPSKDKFFATTFVSEFPDTDDLSFLISQFDSYSIVSRPTRPAEQARWELLPPGTGLQPSACKAYSVSFYGAFYEGEWFIIRSLTFFETADEEMATNTVFPRDVFNQSVYLPYEELHSRYNSTDMLEFITAPFLVSIVKQRRKEKINQAFRQYLEIAVLQRLAEKLRINYPDKYDSMTGMFGSEHFSSIFPLHKRFVLLVTGAKGLSEKGYTIKYLLYIPDAGNIYEWDYFPPGADFHYADSVINQLKTVTYWDAADYLHSSCTLDDDHFWEQCVFKQENGEYKYLRELTFNGESLSSKL